MEIAAVAEKSTHGNGAGRYLSGKELADYLGVSKKFIEKHVAAGRVPGMIRMGRLIHFDREQIDRRLLSGTLLLDGK